MDDHGGRAGHLGRRLLGRQRAAGDDTALLRRIRAGHDAAYGELFAQHADAVRRFAGSLTTDRAEAEDLTAETFFRVLQALRRGSGPTEHVRAYLLTVARRVAAEWWLQRRDVPVTDDELSRRVGVGGDTSGRSAEQKLITTAFTSLPERWRSVLWHVEVEGERPAVVASRFGLSVNATAALARRARQGLRAAYLQAHLSRHAGPHDCRSTVAKLGAYTAGTLRGGEERRVREHLASCVTCQSSHDELRDVCFALRAHAGALLVPAALGALAVQQAGASSGFGALVHGAFAGARMKVGMALASGAVVGAVGLSAVPFTDDGSNTAFQLPGSPTDRLTVVTTTPGPPSGDAVRPPTETRPISPPPAEPPEPSGSSAEREQSESARPPVPSGAQQAPAEPDGQGERPDARLDTPLDDSVESSRSTLSSTLSEPSPELPSSELPSSEVPSSELPSTDFPSIEPPSSEPPSTSEPPATTTPTTPTSPTVINPPPRPPCLPPPWYPGQPWEWYPPVDCLPR
ncbi:RNA polymerase sigma factor (sigma-70 family) [Tamaricihabitans halophyticus]|uniref:RNA polymerase sigma factor (Sigma-70 family) n=1 Tax=Tamaricihabitans halophyticus TaxID=1262583 RepID=A0A4V6NRG6_9PSEU|nr:RNA polymerase sigma factor (sigma-70 family) [Tamaricihabitans halophyticus]